MTTIKIQTSQLKVHCEWQVHIKLIISFRQMDENQLIGVFVKQIKYFETDFLLSDSSVECYLVDKTSGTCTKGNSSNSNLLSYISPFRLSQFELDSRALTQLWKKLIVIDKSIDELNSENKMLLFEVCKTQQDQNEEQSSKARLAFAFLIPLAPDGAMNTNQNLKLQLYKIRKKCKMSHHDCNIYHLYADHKLKKVPGSLQVAVKGVVPTKIKRQKNEEIATQDKPRPVSAEKKVNVNLLPARLVPEKPKWSRLTTQSCKVPNKIYKALSPGKNGFSCLKFSRSGFQVAAAVLSKIIIQEVISGNEVTDLNSHIGFIYELDWSFDDKYLLSVSNDCRGVVWDIAKSAPVFLLPHPSYVYCGRWFENDQQIVTGGKDHLIRYWRCDGDGFHLIEEMGGHSGFISSLATQQNSLMISGDSLGCIMIRKFESDGWNLVKTLCFPEISQKVVDSILVHSSRRRIIVSVRSRSSYLIDFVSGIILQTFKSSINTFARSVSCLTPCESFLFSLCQNGDVGVWEVNTGKIFATYTNLFKVDRLTELSGYIHYHPFEHMVGISIVMPNHPLLILKYESSNDNDSKKLGLSFPMKKSENCLSAEAILSSRSLLPLRKQEK